MLKPTLKDQFSGFTYLSGYLSNYFDFMLAIV